MKRTRRWLLGLLLAVAAVAVYIHATEPEVTADADETSRQPDDSDGVVTPQTPQTPQSPPAGTAPSDEPAEPADKPSGQENDDPADEGEPGAAEDAAGRSLVAAADWPSRSIRETKGGLAVVTNADSLLVMVNKKRNLPSDFEPDNLVVPDVPFSFSGDHPKKQLQEPAAKALERLFAAAEEDGIRLKAVSGYRSYATQKAIFSRNAKQKGEEIANRTSARAGQSEHQTGLAMDVSSASVGYALEESFGKTKEGRWLAKHAAEHGFIIRYPKGKEDVTGYAYEPWHLRYVGEDIAGEIMDKGLTLEEFFEAIEAESKA